MEPGVPQPKISITLIYEEFLEMLDISFDMKEGSPFSDLLSKLLMI